MMDEEADHGADHAETSGRRSGSSRADVSPFEWRRRGHGKHPGVWVPRCTTRFIRSSVVVATKPGETGPNKRNKTLAHDRLGVRWGLAGGTTLATVEEARDAARFAEASEFDGLCVAAHNAKRPRPQTSPN